MYLIGLAGRAGSGKDTVAEILCETLNRSTETTCGLSGWQHFSFSDSLYAEVSAAYEVPTTWLKCRDTKEVPQDRLALRYCNDEAFNAVVEPLVQRRRDCALSPRQVLQWWGTEYRRAEDPNYWLKCAEKHIVAARERGVRGLVNTSVRFFNEVDFIRSYGGLIYLIRRPGQEAVHAHCSEHQIGSNDAHGQIINREGPEWYEKLQSAVHDMIEQWGLRDGRGG